MDALADATARRALRAFLLQRRWFAASAVGGCLEGARLDLLRALPVFETYGCGGGGSGGGGSGDEKTVVVGDTKAVTKHGGVVVVANTAADSIAFCYLSSTPAPLLAPAGTDVTLLPRTFLKLDDAAEGTLLETYAGVTRVTTAALLADHVIPALANAVLPAASAPRALDAALAAITAARASWTGAADGERLANAVKRHACIPTLGGRLARPIDLYDPRVRNLLELLDPREHFPAPPFDAGERLLALSVLGVRTSLGAEGLVASARSVECLAKTPGGAAAAAVRGRALLEHLNALAAVTAGESGGALPAADAVLEGGCAVWRELGALAWYTLGPKLKTRNRTPYTMHLTP
jgi:sacsin